MSDLPTIGAAMCLEDIDAHRDWLFAAPRDLELQDFHQADVLNGDWSGLVSQAKAKLDGLPGRLGIHGPFWGFTIDSWDEDVRALVTKRMHQGLDVCQALDATLMVIHSPYRTWDHNNLDNYPDARDKLVERVHATLKDVVARAEDQGVTLVIENIEDVDPHARVALAQSFGSDAVKVSIDTGHAHYAHCSTGAPPVDYFVHAAANALHHVHLQDADGHADRHWAIGEGTIRWPAIFRALQAVTSQPRLILELRNKAGIPASFQHLAQAGLAQ